MFWFWFLVLPQKFFVTRNLRDALNNHGSNYACCHVSMQGPFSNFVYNVHISKLLNAGLQRRIQDFSNSRRALNPDSYQAIFFNQLFTVNVVKGLRAMYHVRSDSVIVFLECVAGG